MSYRLQRKKKEKRRRTAGLVVAVVALLVAVIFNLQPPRFATGFLLSIASPIWKFRNLVAERSSVFFSSFVSKEKLARENKLLGDGLDIANLKLFDRNLLRDENALLKEMLGRIPEGEMVIASILSRPNATPYDTFIIDVGENLNISEGDEVFASEGILIGSIDEVYSKISTAKLFSSPGLETKVVFQEVEVEATAVGRGGGNLSARLPKAIDVSRGEEVVMPGTDIALLGVVEDIESNEADLFQTVLFRMPINITGMKWVFIKRVVQ